MVQKFIIEDALIIIPVLLIFGFILKNTPNVQDWLIPWVLLVIGILLALLLLGLSANSLVQGILVVGAAVLIHQLYRQTKGHKNDD